MRQRYFLVHADRFEPVATALLGAEADWLKEYRWWPLKALEGAEQSLNLEPDHLAAGVARYLAEGLPDSPYDIDDPDFH